MRTGLQRLCYLLVVLGCLTWSTAAQATFEVAAVTPSDHAGDVDPESAQIAIAFDRPIVPLVSNENKADLPQPLILEPDVSGSGRWITTSLYVFSPYPGRLKGGAAYRATIKAGLTAVDGSMLGENYQWTFRTIAPQTLQFLGTKIFKQDYLNPLRLDSGFSISFTQPMDTSSTEAAFHVWQHANDRATSENESGPDVLVQGTITWNDKHTRLTFQPTDLLLPAHYYTVTLDPSAMNAHGSAILKQDDTETSSETFETVWQPRPVLENHHTFQIEPGYARLDVKFNTFMNRDTMTNHVTIEPQPQGEVKMFAADTRLGLAFTAENNVDYTITLDAAMSDAYGYTLGSDYVFTAETHEPPLPPPAPKGSFGFAPRYPIVILGMYPEILTLPITVTGEPTINWGLYNFDLNMLAPYKAGIASWFNWAYHFTDLFTVLFFHEMPKEDRSWDSVPYNPPWLTEDNRLYTWSQTLREPMRENKTIRVPLMLPNGEPFPVGIYGLELQPSSETRADTIAPYGWGGDRRSTILVISNVAISLRRSPLGAFIWVTDLETASPVPDAIIKGYSLESSVILGMTDENGILEISGTIPDYITVEDETHYGMWLDWSEQETPTEQSYLYTDRAMYRPGETVYFRGIVRDQADIAYSVPNLDTVSVSVRSYDRQNGYEILDEMRLPLTQYGTVSGSWTVPQDAALTDYSLVLTACSPSQSECDIVSEEYRYDYWAILPRYFQSVSFRVAEFRVPEFAVTVDAESDNIISGDPLNVQVSAAYYFGSSVIGADVRVEASQNRYSPWPDPFDYQGDERGYRFGNRFYWDYYYEEGFFETVETQGTTDDQGLYSISEITKQEGSLPQPVIVNATVTDASGQAISASDELIVHPAALYVGLRATASFFPVDEPQTIDILTVNLDSTPYPDQMVQLELVEDRWRYVREEGRKYYSWQHEAIPQGTETLTTDAAGKAAYTFTPPNEGAFYLKATTTDDAGRVATTTLRLYASPTRKDKNVHIGGNPYSYNEICGYTSDYRELALSKDSEVYQPGDTAQIYIPNPFEDTVTALITLERGTVIDYDIVEIEGSSYTYILPIIDAYAPNISVEVLLMQGVSDEHPDPLYERGDIELIIEPSAQRLTVEILPAVDTAQPGDEVTIQIRVTDREGTPVQAEVGVAVTDEAALAVYNNPDTTLEGTFYSPQPDSVVDSTSLKLLLTNPIYTIDTGCGGGAGSGEVINNTILREDFIYTPLWTTVITNEQGIGEVTVILPDNLTRWRIDARAVTLDTKVGQATSTIITTMPLIVRPVTPRFVVTGDVLPLTGVIHNNTDETQRVTASVTVGGIALEANAPLEVEIPPHGQSVVEWVGRVEDVPSVDFRIDVVSESGLSDAARPILRTSPDDKIPVYRYIAPDTVTTSGVLTENGSITEQILLPMQFSEVTGQLDVTLQTSLAAVTLDSLDYLENYPHQCIEQTVSRFLPNIATYRALNSFDIADDALESHLTVAMGYALGRLEDDQNDDGGWGWFSRMDSNTLTTAYALIGLAEVRAAELPFDVSVADRAAAYLHEQAAIPVSRRETSWQVSRRAIALYALSQWEGNPASLESFADVLFQRRLSVSLSARAFLLMSYRRIDPDSAAIHTLISDLTSAALITASGVSWDEPDEYGWNWDSDTRTTALALMALTQVQPENPLLPNVVRWLTMARKGDHWETTQETAWSILALTQWMITTQELDAEYEYRVLLNDVVLMGRSITDDQLPTESSLMVSTDYNSLLSENILTIEREEGPGNLYYTATLNLDLPAQEVKAFANGIFVEREYVTELTPKTSKPILDPRVGDIVTVRLSVTLSEDVNYFVLEDWLPAGFEPIDPQLATTETSASALGLNCVYPGEPYWCWAAWFFDHTELRDTGLQLYAEYLPRGGYVFSYQARVVSEGEFQAIPTQAYAFYQPETYGRGDGAIIKVEPRR